MPVTRRSLLLLAATLATHPARPLLANGRTMTPPIDSVPPRPSRPTPGQPGDFDFLAGNWRIEHYWRASPDAEWISFRGEATCWTILGGIGSVEELRIPARDFSGMGLRLLDVEKRVWSDFWVNAKSGVLAREGTTGSFENGVGIFIGDDTDDGRPLLAGGLWDQITPTRCRWRQVVSRDAGQTWQHTWVMLWQRA
jgi:hypothetical protein